MGINGKYVQFSLTNLTFKYPNIFAMWPYQIRMDEILTDKKWWISLVWELHIMQEDKSDK